MNYTMARYIDELDDDGRDRLVTAEDFNDGWDYWSYNCGCLVGTAEANHRPSTAERRRVTTALQCDTWQLQPASFRYPKAVRRFGKARVVRAIKARASSGMSREYEAPPAAVEAGQ
jgi:hypothetical protein